MQNKNWLCPKCKHKEYEVGEIRVTGSFWTKILNVQNKNMLQFHVRNVLIQNFTRISHHHVLQMYSIYLQLNNYLKGIICHQKKLI